MQISSRAAAAENDTDRLACCEAGETAVVLNTIQSHMVMPSDLTRTEPFHCSHRRLASIAMHEYQFFPCEAIAEFPGHHPAFNLSGVRIRTGGCHKEDQVGLPHAEVRPVGWSGIAFIDDIPELVFLLV